jgi:hypothetical protein
MINLFKQSIENTFDSTILTAMSLSFSRRMTGSGMSLTDSQPNRPLIDAESTQLFLSSLSSTVVLK